MREHDTVVSADGLSNDDLVDVVELVPVVVFGQPVRRIPKRRLELQAARNGAIGRFGCEEGPASKQC